MVTDLEEFPVEVEDVWIVRIGANVSSLKKHAFGYVICRFSEVSFGDLQQVEQSALGVVCENGVGSHLDEREAVL